MMNYLNCGHDISFKKGKFESVKHFVSGVITVMFL